MDRSFFSDKTVLVTGHTGFKGSWITRMLLDAGARVVGYALEPPTDPALFDLLSLGERLGERHVTGDIRDGARLLSVFRTYEPEIVLHMAAQPIVRTSFEDPVRTFDVNVMGTVQVLECIRKTPSVRSFLNVTTDKVYENTETGRPFTDEDRLDGHDPYSNSKSCSELVTHSYVKSFFEGRGIAVSTARAGNVIGGGDYAKDRLIPDCVRAAKAHRHVFLRNPDAVRPFQHVLEPLDAYLQILEAQYRDPSLAGSYNVGPDEGNCLRVREMAALFAEAWGDGASFEIHADGGPREAGLLRLDNRKIRETLGWRPVWGAAEAIRQTVAFEKAEDKDAEILRQIRAFYDAPGERAAGTA